jgi:hypothetical protein
MWCFLSQENGRIILGYQTAEAIAKWILYADVILDLSDFKE